jgi:hypothetical protein
MKRLIVLAGLILASCLLTGCFGLVVGHPRQKCSEQFSLGNRGVVSNAASAIPLTEEIVLELWGQPDAKHLETNAVTVWQYRGKMGWTVVVPAYIIGLPLPFPAGHNQVDIYFQDGIAWKASRPVMVATGVFIGIMPAVVVCAWEREGLDEPYPFIIGCGFHKDEKPVQTKP